MSPILLIDGNNLGHFLGYIDKATDRYDIASLLSSLDGVARYLATQGQEVDIVLFLDDVTAAERIGGWHVQVAPVPGGDADAAIRAFAASHAQRPLTLVSGDQALCDDAAMWGAVCLSPKAFISRYLDPARRAGVFNDGTRTEMAITLGGAQASDQTTASSRETASLGSHDQSTVERQRHAEALERTEAALRGEPLPSPEVYRLDLSRWADDAELALYLAEHHLCPAHANLTEPSAMIAAIRDHCSLQPRYFTSGRVINRVFRLFLCRAEHTLSLDDLTPLAKTRRRKIRAAIEKYGEALGIVLAW
jgi:hypothetical protein